MIDVVREVMFIFIVNKVTKVFRDLFQSYGQRYRGQPNFLMMFNSFQSIQRIAVMLAVIAAILVFSIGAAMAQTDTLWTEYFTGESGISNTSTLVGDQWSATETTSGQSGTMSVESEAFKFTGGSAQTTYTCTWQSDPISISGYSSASLSVSYTPGGDGGQNEVSEPTITVSGDGATATISFTFSVAKNKHKTLDNIVLTGTCAASTWYADADGDGLGNAGSSASACSQPAGYVSDNTDNCDDTSACNYSDAGNASCTFGATWYADSDGDGMGDAGTSTSACTQPAGYVASNTDNCDDTSACNYSDAGNASCTFGTTWYVDTDGDGMGDAGTSTSACSQPAGYVANNTDSCDDATACNYAAAGNPSCNYGTTWYADVDGDGAGDAGTSVTACSQPANYVATATDCDDSDGSITTLTWYEDSDGDGLGDPASTTQACSQPVGYVDNNTDDDPNLNALLFTGTVLYPGDVYFSYACEAYEGISRSHVGFILLKDVEAGTKLVLSPSMQWDGDSWANATTAYEWTAPADGVAAGTEVILFDIQNTSLSTGSSLDAKCDTINNLLRRNAGNTDLEGGVQCGTYRSLTSTLDFFTWDTEAAWIFQPDDNWDISNVGQVNNDQQCRQLNCLGYDLGFSIGNGGNAVANTGTGTLISGSEWTSFDPEYSYQDALFQNASQWAYGGGSDLIPFTSVGDELIPQTMKESVSFSAAAGATPSYTSTTTAGSTVAAAYDALDFNPNGCISLPQSIGWDALATGPGAPIGTPGGSATLNITVDNGISLSVDVADAVACNDITVTTGSFSACDGLSRELSVSGDIMLGETSTFEGGVGTLKMAGFTLQTLDANNYSDPTSTKVQLNNLQVLNNKAVTVQGHVKMKPGGALEFDDTAINESVVVSSAVSSSITFESNAAGTAAIGPCSASNFGDGTSQEFNFQRYIPADPDGTSWVNIGSYVTGTTVADWTASNASMLIFKYNESNYGSQSAGWSYLWDASTELLPGSGYMAMIPQNQDALISVTGAFQIGDVPITLTFTDDPNQSNTTVDGWNLVSNPFAAPVNMQQVLAGTGISTWYVFDNQTADAYIAGGSDAPSVLDVGQSMWIKVDTETVITFSEEDKVMDTDGTFVREFTEDYMGTVGLQVSNTSDNLARAFVKFEANTTVAFDSEHDALMYNSTGTADLGVWMVAESGEKLSRQAAGLIGEVSSIPLKVNSGGGGLTEFYAFNHPEAPDYTCVVVEDTETGERAQLGSDTLTVDLPANMHFADRFVLHFTPVPSMTWQSTACNGLEVEMTGEAWETWEATWTSNDGSVSGEGLPYELADGDYTFEFELAEAGCSQSVAVTVETACLGDFNLNGERDIIDLLVILAGLPGGTLENEFAEEADCDCDGTVTVNDMLTFLTVFASPCE